MLGLATGGIMVSTSINKHSQPHVPDTHRSIEQVARATTTISGSVSMQGTKTQTAIARIVTTEEA